MTEAPKHYRIRITSGAEAGRYVGMSFGGGYVSNPEVLKSPPVNVPGSGYGLWAQQRGATVFINADAADEIVPGLVESGGSRLRARYATCSC
jgi:hypothetical protein